MEIRLLKEPELLPALHLVWEVFAAEIAPTCTPQGVESFQKFIKYDYISQVSRVKVYMEEFEKTPKRSIKRYLYTRK